MKTAAIVGHFGFGYEYLDGQTVKTKILAAELKNQLGDQEISCIDTHGGAKSTPKLLLRCVSALKHHRNVIALPAHNGVRIVIPWLLFVNRFFHRRIHYAVIGGWLPNLLKEKRGLAKKLKKLDGIYVETTSMKEALEEMGFANIVVMPNCKELCVLTKEELVYPESEPYRLCTFSRVMREKGIEDAVQAVKAVNGKLGRTVYTLDIYGPVDPSQTEWFENLQKEFPAYVRYGGLVPFDKSVEVLKDYFALLFPTRFYTEGIPGTFIDAYAAGIPVITSMWKNSGDIFENGVQGLGYEFEKPSELERILFELSQDNEVFISLKPNCIEKAKCYLPKSVLTVLVERCK
ncbi:MAG: glycosyltransferase [Clostridia bacterium]|nr:glycosyltransferase [Clostridia bacterium]